ncbi:MAG: hypothetical protein AAGG02_11655 [Cyanobacteria bacterium P01_H01_bin.15]
MNKDKRQLLQKAAATHRQNLKSNLERRLEAARSRGDQKLINQLEAEAFYLRLI